MHMGCDIYYHWKAEASYSVWTEKRCSNASKTLHVNISNTDIIVLKWHERRVLQPESF